MNKNIKKAMSEWNNERMKQWKMIERTGERPNEP